MKRTIILTAIALMISAGITAQIPTTGQEGQDQNNERKETKVQTQTRQNEQVRMQDESGIQKQTKTEEKDAKRNKEKIAKQKIAKQEKAKKEKAEKSNHGQRVSQTAKSTESGPGKGEVVSGEAKTQGELKQAQENAKKAGPEQGINSGARGNSTQKPNINGPKGQGAIRK